MAAGPEYRHLVKRHHESKAKDAGSAGDGIDNINKSTTTTTTKGQEPDTTKIVQAIHDKNEILNMCANVKKKAIAYVQERIQKTKGELEKRVKGCFG